MTSHRIRNAGTPSVVGGRLTALVVATVLALGGVAPASAATTIRGTGLELLAGLATAAEHPAGYDRSLFVHWSDSDKDGCSTRAEVLIAESRTTARFGANCAITGSWRSAYDGVITSAPSKLDIDHVVAHFIAIWLPIRYRSWRSSNQ